MHVAYVTPRYGREIVGGAERAVREFAERLVAGFQWRVDVLTTCARDLRTWANELPAGTTEEAGVTVSRFPTAHLRPADFDATSAALLAAPGRVETDRARDWIAAQGPHSPELLDAIAATTADLVVFYPYLYEPTVEGVARVPGRAVMHPAAHDEPPIRLPVFPPVFAAVQGLVFQTYAEARFVNERFAVAATPQIVLGLGAEPGPGDPDAARAALGLGDDPYLCCVGRVDDGKGTGALARCFAAYKARRPGPLRLVLAGPVADVPPPHPDVVLAGAIDEATKWGLLRGATALVQPSALEAFSLVLVEAWHVGLPVLVNARCAATLEHCERSGGGLPFADYASFEVALDRLLADPVLGASMGAAGRAYVEAHFAWPHLLERYVEFLERTGDRIAGVGGP